MTKEAESSRWNFLRHPTERGEGHSRFDRAAEIASNLASSSLFFSVCLLIAAAWAIGLIVGLPSATENDLVGGMAAMTLLLVAVLKNSERRAERAMQLKLDAIAAALLDRQENGSMDRATHVELEDAVRLHEEILSSGALSGRRQGQRGGLEMQRLEPAQLGRRALGQRAQLEALELVGVSVLKCSPQPPLAGDADLQQLQLVEAAERRVAMQLPVRLQPAKPLAE